MIRRVLIANRGEIAIRIARACARRGSKASRSIRSRRALPACRAATRAILIGPAFVHSYRPSPPSSTRPDRPRAMPYTRLRVPVQNATFARESTCGAGLRGPPADVIERMGSKIAARALMLAAGSRSFPAAAEDQSDEGILAPPTRGVPVLVKPPPAAVAGMRVVRTTTRGTWFPQRDGRQSRPLATVRCTSNG